MSVESTLFPLELTTAQAGYLLEGRDVGSVTPKFLEWRPSMERKGQLTSSVPSCCSGLTSSAERNCHFAKLTFSIARQPNYVSRP